MGLFSIFGRKKRKKNIEAADSVIDTKLEDVDFSKLSYEERSRYVEEQCAAIVECNNNVENAKKEYKTISSYFADIQIIESQPDDMRVRVILR